MYIYYHISIQYSYLYSYAKSAKPVSWITFMYHKSHINAFHNPHMYEWGPLNGVTYKASIVNIVYTCQSINAKIVFYDNLFEIIKKSCLLYVFIRCPLQASTDRLMFKAVN
jgi:hypothetical protein